MPVLRLSCLFLFLAVSSTASAKCIPPIEVIPGLTGLGGFLRVHPSGDKLIGTPIDTKENPIQDPQEKYQKMRLVDFSERGSYGQRLVKVKKTPFTAEAFPVESKNGEWSYVASPNFDTDPNSMSYYEFSQVENMGSKSQDVFKDNTHTGVYHSSAELPGSDDKVTKIRTVLWRNQKLKDYTLTKDPLTKKIQVEASRQGKICRNIVYAGLSQEEIGIEDKRWGLLGALELMAMKGVQNLEENPQRKALLAEIMKIPENPKVKRFDEPVINKNGTEIAAVVDNTMRIFKINQDLSCTQVLDLEAQTSKVRFSSPRGNNKGLISYSKKVLVHGEMIGMTFILDRDKNRTIAFRNDKLGVKYTGHVDFAKDGRAITVAALNDSNSDAILILDPNQIDEKTGAFKTDPATCIHSSSSSQGGEVDGAH